ncbi:MAG TPA: DUF2948 family protein [Rhizomicrobium sp.]|nr:DUF2948 family protein [Rhizomicrobium sp.]
MTAKELTLAAEDTEDLEIVSARLQDAVVRVKDLVWLPKSRRFAGLFNRFKWEEPKKRDLRVRARLYFDDVISVKSINLRRDVPDGVLSLLAIRFTPNGEGDPSGTVALLFAGGAEIRLDVESINAGLTDVSGDWAALGRPDHDRL